MVNRQLKLFTFFIIFLLVAETAPLTSSLNHQPKSNKVKDFTVHNQSLSTRGVVTIAFDDGTLSQYENAYPLMKDKGIVGTFYVTTNFLGDGSHLTIAELQDLQANGNEIGSHSQSHPDFTSISESQIREECDGSKQVLQSNGLTVNNFAYPYGACNSFTDSIVSQYYRSARSAYTPPYIMSFPTSQFVLAGYEGETYDPSSWSQLDAIQAAEHEVDQVASNGGWVIIFFHNVVWGDYSNPYEIAAEYFVDFLNYVKASDVSILTVNQALNFGEPAKSVYYGFSVDPSIHNDYGLTYPVTYEFSLPSGVSSVNAYRKFALGQDWVRIVEKTSNDFFNGIEAVRFDYTNHIAYVSIAYASFSDFIYVYFTDSSGNEISTRYLGTAKYYDNRRVTLCISLDDLGGPPPWGVQGGDYSLVSMAFADAKIWWSGGITTSWIGDWGSLQNAVDQGYFEVASHSRDHPSVPYEDYESEIGGSKQDIVDNLSLNPLYAKGNQQYVWCWIEPSGQSDDMVQQTLAKHHYLVSRTTAGELPTQIKSWNSTYGIFDRQDVSYYIDFDSLEEINSYFDSVYDNPAGGFYNEYGHVGQLDWSVGGRGYEHLQHMAGKLDVWYVGLGALYAYTYTCLFEKNMSVNINSTSPEMDVGQQQTFSSDVSGGIPPYSYQWCLNDRQVSGATASNWTFAPSASGQYNIYVNVTDSNNLLISSNIVTIDVYSQPSVTIKPATVSMTIGTTKQFTSTVTGGLMPYTYQWYLNDSAVSGATASVWNFVPTVTGHFKVYLKVIDALNFGVQSNVVLDIIVNPKSTVVISPTSVNVTVGSSQIFGSTVEGGSSPFSYQWYQNDTVVTGATSPSWTFTPPSAGTYIIYLNITDSSGVTAKSSNAIAKVETPIIVNINPTHLKMNIGQTQTFSSSVSGGTMPYSYQWYLNNTAVAGGTKSNWTFTPVTPGNYRVFLNVTDSLNRQVQSNIVTDITVYSQLTVTIFPAYVNMTVGKAQTFNSAISGGEKPYTYLWYLNGSAVPDTNSSFWTFTPSSNGTYNIYVNATDNIGTIAQSNTATAYVETPLNVTINPTQVKMYLGQSQTFNSTESGGTAPYSYQWYLNESAQADGINQTWTFTPNTAGHYKIYLNVTDALNIKAQSNIVTDITVYQQLNVTINPTIIHMTAGTSRTISSIVTGGTTPYFYKWYLNGTEVTGANGPNWIFTPSSTGTYIIYLNVTDTSAVTAKSNVATAIVETPMTINLTPSQVKMYIGQSQTFNSTVSGGTAPYYYQWYLNDTAVFGATSQNWTFTPVAAGNYKVYLNVADALSIVSQSNLVTDITVLPQLTVAISPTSMNMTVGTPQTFISIVSGGAQPYTYQWYLNGNPVLYANSSSWTYTPTAQGNYTIYLKVTDANSQSSQSNVVAVQVENTLSLTINTDRPRYIKWSYITINVNATDLLNGTAVQGATVNITIYDTHGRTIWTKTSLTDTTGTAQFKYLLAFDAQFGDYTIDASVTAGGYNQKSVLTTFFSMG